MKQPSQPASVDRLPYAWRVVAASIRGSAHERAKMPCQDAHHWEALPDGTLVAAVADGAGTAALAEVGADVASRTAIETMRIRRAAQPLPTDDGSWKTLLADVLRTAKKAVEEEAEARGVMERELATTLILVVATDQLVAAVQVGDGGVVITDDEDHIISITAPTRGEYINETTFLASSDSLDTAMIKVWWGIAKAVCVFSDGLQMLALKMPEATPHDMFFSPLFQFVSKASDDAWAQERLTAFLRSGRVTERTDDDLTLLLAAHVDPEHS